MQATLKFPSHPSEETLRNYAFHRLSRRQAADFEEHLLFCNSCQDALEETDQFILLMKAATARPLPRLVWRVPLPLAIRTAAWGGGLTAAAVAIMAIAWQPAEPPSPAPVTLASFRGAQDATMAHSPAGRPLVLAVDAPDVPSSGTYRIEVVNAVGKLAWKSPMTPSAGKLTAVVPVRLDAGVYWVRLYASDSELLREFGLMLE